MADQGRGGAGLSAPSITAASGSRPFGRVDWAGNDDQPASFFGNKSFQQLDLACLQRLPVWVESDDAVILEQLVGQLWEFEEHFIRFLGNAHFGSLQQDVQDGVLVTEDLVAEEPVFTCGTARHEQDFHASIDTLDDS